MGIGKILGFRFAAVAETADVHVVAWFCEKEAVFVGCYGVFVEEGEELGFFGWGFWMSTRGSCVEGMVECLENAVDYSVGVEFRVVPA